MSIRDRLEHAWNAFLNRDPTTINYNFGSGYSYRPDRPRMSKGHEKSLVTSVINRLAVDAASVDIKHVKTDNSGRYIEDMLSGLNYCLKTEANIDQTGRSFIKDAIFSMLDEGVVALVPIDTDSDIKTGTFDILSIRVAKIIQWYPSHVQIRVYNDRTGQREDVIVPKHSISIIENPFYAVMNEPNSTMQRLIRKLDLLDVVDEQSSSGKLDLIIQLPYVIKSEARRQQAELRRKAIEEQLNNSKYGIAYTDGTEKVIQLNRSVENNLMKQVEYLTNLLYSQLGLTIEILNGTADDTAMNNYFSRTIEPILSTLSEEMSRKFLTKTARTRKQTIQYFRDPFKLVPISSLADIVDKFTRNEVLTSNEVRQIVGLAPSNDPNANALRNKNISAAKDQVLYDVDGEPIITPNAESQKTSEEENSK